MFYKMFGNAGSGGSGGHAGAVQSVNGKTGVVAISKVDIGLGSVTNTADADKPVSTATQTALDLKIDLTQKGAANGVATLGTDGKVPSDQISAIATGNTFVVDDVSARLAVAAAQGDVAVQIDTNESWILKQTPASTGANWVKLLFPAAVASVSGRTGAVSLTKADVGLNNVDNTTDLSKPLSTAMITALEDKYDSCAVNQSSGSMVMSFNVGSSITFPRADATFDGVMSNADKAKLDGLANTVVVNTLTSNATTSALSAAQGKALKTLADTKAGSGEVAKAHDQTKAYLAGDLAYNGSVVVKANADIPANTVFNWGVSGATWSPASLSRGTWKGVFAVNTAYAADDIIVHSVNAWAPLMRVSTGFTSAASGSLIGQTRTAGAAHVGKVNAFVAGQNDLSWTESAMIACTSTVDGASGAVPAPAAGRHRHLLTGAGWQNTIGSTLSRRRATTQTISNNSSTVVLFSSNDTAPSFNEAGTGLTYTGSTGEFKCNVDGGASYLVNFQVCFLGSASQAGNKARIAWLRYQNDNANRFGVTMTTVPSSTEALISGSCVVSPNKDGVFHIMCYQDSGASIDIGGAIAGMANGYSTRVQVTRLSQ